MATQSYDGFYNIRADSAWKGVRLAAVELKRILDSKTSFDFTTKMKAGKVLLVGEGNLSFSVALSALAGTTKSIVIATTFQGEDQYSEFTAENAEILRRKGVSVKSGIDATNLSRWFGRRRFDLIIFQFPNVASREPRYGRNPNHILVRRFLKSAADQVNAKGEVAITAVNSPHYDGAFDMDGAIKHTDYDGPFAYPFYFSDYPGYIHVKTKDDGVSPLREEDEFVTYMFRRKEIEL